MGHRCVDGAVSAKWRAITFRVTEVAWGMIPLGLEADNTVQSRQTARPTAGTKGATIKSNIHKYERRNDRSTPKTMKVANMAKGDLVIATTITIITGKGANGEAPMGRPALPALSLAEAL